MKRRWLMNFRSLFLFFVLAGFLSACSDEQAVILGPQQWQDLGIRVETRPSPLRVGMNEFIVIASRDEYKPGVGLVVQLRVGENGKWRQAIQDGFTGVYRRAVQVDDPATQTLFVHLRRSKSDDKNDDTVLAFPLRPHHDAAR
jgi:hypothetical protein